MRFCKRKYLCCLNDDPNRSVEAKTQRTLRKVKNTLSEKKWKRLNPSSSNPGKFYGAAKLHKTGNNVNVNQLLIRPKQ